MPQKPADTDSLFLWVSENLIIDTKRKQNMFFPFTNSFFTSLFQTAMTGKETDWFAVLPQHWQYNQTV